LDEIREKEIEDEIRDSEAAIAREAQVLANASKRYSLEYYQSQYSRILSISI
jgi:hypothetical protein